MITMAERRFPVRIRIGVPPGGFGQRYAGSRHGSTEIAAQTAGQYTHRACAAC
jgi:hypothetical protein